MHSIQHLTDHTTTDTVGDFLLTPFGDVNISPIVEFFARYT